MKIPKLARYNSVVSKAYEFTMKNVTSFPINVIDIIHNMNWALLTYSEYCENNKISVDTLSSIIGKDAYSIYSLEHNNYTIIYNDKIDSIERINFSLAHEIGHIILNHLIDFEQTSLNDNLSENEYKILENEANAFARNLLAPAPLFKNIYSNIFDVFKFRAIFGISNSATITRISLLKNDLYYLNQNDMECIIAKYVEFKYCNTCNSSYFDKDFIYCPYCGKSKLIKGVGFKMKKYKGFDIQTLTECPICENGELESNYQYCKICGLALKNKCTNTACCKGLDDNARFCPYCGSKSILYVNNLLDDWNNAAASYVGNNDNDDDLPF